MNRITPFWIFTLYVLSVVLFGIGYHLFPETTSLKNSGFGKSLYFSVVTITTLGFGDITPKGSAGMFMVASEVILGIVLIGLFLSSLSYSLVSMVESRRQEENEKAVADRSKQSLILFYQYFKPVITDYRQALAESFTPLAQRSRPLDTEREFVISDLQDFYKPSVLIRSGFQTPVYKSYFKKLDELVGESKYILANYDLHEHDRIREILVEIMSISRLYGLSDSIDSYTRTATNDGVKMSDWISEHIKTHELMAEDQYVGNALFPFFALFTSGRYLQSITLELLVEFDALLPTRALQPKLEVGTQP